MKILISSDVHGSLDTARFLVSLVRRMQPDVLLLLGDILYHGPRNPLPANYDPQGTAKVFASVAHTTIAVAGNCDAEVDAAMLPFPLAPQFSWIFADGLRIFATHGHHYSPDNLPVLRQGDIFLFGHTHVPVVKNQRGIYICNPGSLSLPKEDHPPCFAVLDNGTFTVYTDAEEVYLSLDCY